jgi:hypothetical protein
MKALSIAGSRPHTLIEVLCHPLAAIGAAPKRHTGIMPKVGRLSNAAVSAGRAHPVLCGAAIAAVAVGLRWAYLHHRSTNATDDDQPAADGAEASASADHDQADAEPGAD